MSKLRTVKRYLGCTSNHTCLSLLYNSTTVLCNSVTSFSLVPAAAVIPAPIAYIKVVAVKKLVVGSQAVVNGPSDTDVYCCTWSTSGSTFVVPLTGCCGTPEGLL